MAVLDRRQPFLYVLFNKNGIYLMENLTFTQHKSFVLYYLKASFLLFFGCWFSLAFLTNFFDLLQVAGVIAESWHFRSGNYALLAEVVNIYQFPNIVVILLFIADITIQFICAILFFYASLAWLNHKRTWEIINIAFALSILLWMTFIIMEEFFIAYKFEGTHITLIIFELITLLFIHSRY